MLNGYRGPLFMDSYLVLQSIFSFDQGMSIRLELLVLHRLFLLWQLLTLVGMYRLRWSTTA